VDGGVAALLVALADAADAITVPRQADVGRVRRKSDDSPVTEVDRAVERALRDVLARERPDDAILGEEGGGAEAAGRRWLLDPIDGTVHYVRGIPLWATLIGLEVDGRPVAGMVSAPALARRWTGGRVSGTGDLADAVVSVSRYWAAGEASRARIDALAGRAWHAGGYESFLGPVMVAEGAIDAALLPEVEPWDVVPLQAVVEAAGGRVSMLDCGAPRPAALFTNGHLHESVLDVLRA
jgi:histidinol-phosphatase